MHICEYLLCLSFSKNVMDPSELFMYLAIIFSKEKKHLQVVEYWRKKYKEYWDRSDETLRQMQRNHMSWV